MSARVTAGLIWVALLASAFAFAPPPAPGTGALISRMLTGQLEGVNLSLFALFNLMGVLPLAFTALLVFDERQRVPAWPFLLASFAVGAFALLPYLALRRWGGARLPADRLWRRVAGHRATGVVLSALALALTVTLALGDLPAFRALVATQQFPFVMSCDFCACWAAGLLLAWDEARVRRQPRLWLPALLPAIGLPLVLALRDPARDA